MENFAFGSRITYEYTFAKPEDAKRVLDGIKDIIGLYGVATVADLKDLIGCGGGNYTDNEYGWTRVSAGIMAVRMLDYYNPDRGYLLYMPKPMPLESSVENIKKFKPALPKAAKDAKIQKAYNVLTKTLLDKDADTCDLENAMHDAIRYLGEVLE